MTAQLVKVIKILIPSSSCILVIDILDLASYLEILLHAEMISEAEFITVLPMHMYLKKKDRRQCSYLDHSNCLYSEDTGIYVWTTT